MIKFVCEWCGKEFSDRASHVGMRHTCSDQCSHARLAAYTEARFWTFAEKSPDPDGCWIWTGLRRGPYGHFDGLTTGRTSAHRAAYLFSKGAIPPGMVVCHSCDNKLCVNPAHLFLGTQLDNMRDLVAKGLFPHGERRGNSVLTDDKVREIRKLFADGVTQAQIARQFGVNYNTIHSVVTRRTWTHL